MTDGAPGKIRVDKWLWQARFFKTRGLAGEAAGSGSMRVNGERIAKPAHAVRPGDVLTFPKAGAIRVIRVEAIGVRRGPAPEAAALYTDLEPPPPPSPAEARPGGAPASGGGRPTKRERRQLETMRRRDT